MKSITKSTRMILEDRIGLGSFYLSVSYNFMRFNIVIILIFLSPKSYSQAPGVLDAHFISERHNTFINLIEIGGKVWVDFYEKYRNKEFKSLQKEDSIFINSSRMANPSYYPNRIGMPYLYLLHEDDHWAIRTFKTINLETSYQGIFWEKGPMRHKYIRESDKSIRTDTVYNANGNHIFKKIIEEGVNNGNITPYINAEYDYILDKNYHLDSSAQDSLANLLALCNKIVVKEDYFYNKHTGITGSQIISIGFFKDNQQLIWTYYPELSYTLRNNFLLFDYDLNLQFYTTFDEIFKNHLYDIESLSTTALRINDISWNHIRKEDSKLEYLTELNALFYVDLLKSYVNANYRNYSGIVELQVHDGLTLNASLENGQIQGKCSLFKPDKTPKIEISFKNHIANGDYFEYHSNGKIKESGKFEMGLKTGLWINYFIEGEKMAQRNYLRGWLDGEQIFWYRDGKEYMTFNYSNFMLNGPFSRYNSNGTPSESGYFTNNYPDKSWTINLTLPEEYVNIVQRNKELDWLYSPEAYQDGILSYSVVLEQGPKKTDCPSPIYTCVSLVSMSEVK